MGGGGASQPYLARLLLRSFRFPPLAPQRARARAHTRWSRPPLHLGSLLDPDGGRHRTIKEGTVRKQSTPALRRKIKGERKPTRANRRGEPPFRQRRPPSGKGVTHGAELRTHGGGLERRGGGRGEGGSASRSENKERARVEAAAALDPSKRFDSTVKAERRAPRPFPPHHRHRQPPSSTPLCPQEGSTSQRHRFVFQTVWGGGGVGEVVGGGRLCLLAVPFLSRPRLEDEARPIIVAAREH